MMHFNLAALLISAIHFASVVAIPSGYKSVTPDLLTSLPANTTKVIIASGTYGTELNVAYGGTEQGSPVIMYTPSTAGSNNQQVWPEVSSCYASNTYLSSGSLPMS